MIVDSQIHLWRDASPSPIHRQQREFWAEECLAEMNAAGVDAAILCPPVFYPEGNHTFDEVITAHPNRFAGWGFLDLADPASRERIKTWRRPPLQLGLRFTLIQPHNAQYWTDGTMDWMWAEAEKHCPLVSFYAFSHLDIIAARATRHPGLRIVIDHMGLEGIKKAPDGLSEFAKLLELARLPNVAVKLTGVQAASAETYPFRDMHEPIRRTIDAFGPERVFWGTDLTRMPCSYRQCVTMFTEEMPWLKGHDLNLVMGEGFMRWARWRPSSDEATP